MPIWRSRLMRNRPAPATVEAFCGPRLSRARSSSTRVEAMGQSFSLVMCCMSRSGVASAMGTSAVIRPSASV